MSKSIWKKNDRVSIVKEMRDGTRLVLSGVIIEYHPRSRTMELKTDHGTYKNLLCDVDENCLCFEMSRES